jgi:rifampicin phosphotransferase
MNSVPNILSFSSNAATLESVGGKGLSLSRLFRAGHQVPNGFLITTTAYRVFIKANDLENHLFTILGRLPQNNMAALEETSNAIRALFEEGALPPDLAEEICAAYRAAGAGPVAVRSSATAEDLPDLSFAGQQETYLNVLGEQALLQAVVNCWSSLWTARAIGYRARQGISSTDLALAVVVQKMVPSKASGVLFTANPLSGLRSEVVIDAILGLGEALVSGQVTPDHYVVDTQKQMIVSKTLGAKALSIRSNPGGGTATLTEDAANIQALPDEQILALSRLGKQVEAETGLPQDIEWGWAEETLSLLQSRPITSLFPLPDNGPLDPQTGAARGPLKVYFSFGAVQGVLDPLTPLGGDLIRGVFSLGAGLFGYHYTLDNNPVLGWSGERLWVNIATLLRNSVGRNVARGALNLVEPSVRQALMKIWDDPDLQPQKKGVSLAAIRRMSHFFPRVFFNLLLNMAAPEKRREIIVSHGEQIIADLRQALAELHGSPRENLALGIMATQKLAARRLPKVFPLYISGVAAGMASLNVLNELAKSLPIDPDAANLSGWNDLVLEMTRGLPDNPTTEMDLDLWHISQTIRGDQASIQLFNTSSPDELSRIYLMGDLPPLAQAEITRFFERYGSRGLAEIDMGRPRWRENPTHILQVLCSYIQINNEEQAPSVVFERGAQSAHRAIETLASRLRSQPSGWFKAHIARAVARRMRALLGLREHPKFFAVRMIGVIRQTLLECGKDLVRAGELELADDLFFLHASELQAFASNEKMNWKALITERRTVYQRELKRRQIPRLLLSDGRAFYEGIENENSEKTLMGSPVSPGVVDGMVRVILDPRGAQILQGEILVCPGTDPSWTPLFLVAGGLVMEVGGMMTHGAVVAREYGIPAVVGVHQATTQLVTGQHIRLDGSTGLVTILD